MAACSTSSGARSSCCPADAIPREITLDLKDADINDSLHISQVILPEGVRPAIADRDFTIATIRRRRSRLRKRKKPRRPRKRKEAAREREAAEEDTGEE